MKKHSREKCPECGKVITVLADAKQKTCPILGTNWYHPQCLKQEEDADKGRKDWLWHPGDGPMPI